MQIPQKNNDLKRYVIRRRALRVLLCLLWVALLIGGALLYNQSHENSVLPRILGWRMAVWAVAAVVSGVLIFRIPQTFADRSFSGEIVRSGLSHSYSASSDPGAAQPVSHDFRLNTVLRVRTADGKIKKIRFEQKPGFYLYYHEGNFICHLSGLPYPVADPTRMNVPPRPAFIKDEDSTGNTILDPRKSYVCAACGHFRHEPTVCDHCGLSLIDPKELFGNP